MCEVLESDSSLDDSGNLFSILYDPSSDSGAFGSVTVTLHGDTWSRGGISNKSACETIAAGLITQFDLEYKTREAYNLFSKLVNRRHWELASMFTIVPSACESQVTLYIIYVRDLDMRRSDLQRNILVGSGWIGKKYSLKSPNDKEP